MRTFWNSSRQKLSSLRQNVLQQKKRQDVRQRQRPQQLQQHRKQLRTEIIPQKMFSMMKMEML